MNVQYISRKLCPWYHLVLLYCVYFIDNGTGIPEFTCSAYHLASEIQYVAWNTSIYSTVPIKQEHKRFSQQTLRIFYQCRFVNAYSNNHLHWVYLADVYFSTYFLAPISTEDSFCQCKFVNAYPNIDLLQCFPCQKLVLSPSVIVRQIMGFLCCSISLHLGSVMEQQRYGGRLSCREKKTHVCENLYHDVSLNSWDKPGDIRSSTCGPFY